MEAIERLFSGLSAEEQVNVLATLYWRLTDYQKDEFLEETENA